jgi:hypothetical protein
MNLIKDSSDNTIAEFRRLPGRPPKAGEKTLTFEQKKARLNKLIRHFFKPTYIWFSSGRPKSKFYFV